VLRKVEGEAQRRAMELLTSPDLVKRIAADFSRGGIVGEGTNALRFEPQEGARSPRAPSFAD
jgi:hypothetical protein